MKKQTKAKFAKMSFDLLGPSESLVEANDVEAETSDAGKTATQKAVKKPSQPSRSRMHLAKPVSVPDTQARTSRSEPRAEEDGGEPRRQMTVKLPLSLYTKLSEEKSRRVVTNNKSWSIQDIITEALERHLRAH